MKIHGFYSDRERDRDLVKAFIEGARARGEAAKVYSGAEYPDVPDCDAVVIFGVKGRERYQSYRDLGVQTIYLDKGYIRRSLPGPVKQMEFWRVAVNAHHPTGYLQDVAHSPDRWNSFGVPIEPWRGEGRHIIVAGSSGKFHEFNDLTDPTSYNARIIRGIGQRSTRHLIYRPKPSWDGAEPIPGAEFSKEGRIQGVLRGAHVLVTNGSNACFDAVIAGVPCIVLGDAVARPISSTSIDDVETPRLASERDRLQWLSNLAYCQFSIEEFAAGEGWPHVKRLLQS